MLSGPSVLVSSKFASTLTFFPSIWNTICVWPKRVLGGPRRALDASPVTLRRPSGTIAGTEHRRQAMTTPDQAQRTRPYTGAEYLESLRDGREVWIYGERVKDVTTHPAFRNTARMVARLYDALHDPEKSKTLTVETDTGNGGFTHRFYKP